MNTREELFEKVLYEARNVSGITKSDDGIKTEFDEIYEVFAENLLTGFEIEMWHNLGVHGRMDSGKISIRYNHRFSWSGTYDNEFWCNGYNLTDVLEQIKKELAQRSVDAKAKHREAVLAFWWV